MDSCFSLQNNSKRSEEWFNRVKVKELNAPKGQFEFTVLYELYKTALIWLKGSRRVEAASPHF